MNAAVFGVKEEPVFCYASHNECMRVALAIAMRAFFVVNIAKEVLGRGPIPDRSLADAQKWLESNKRRYSLKKEPQPSHTELSAWLEELSDVVFLVRLADTNVHEE